MTVDSGSDGAVARREQLAAAEQNLDLFAREAVLALDAYERSFPAGNGVSAQQVGGRFAYLWRRYGLDEVSFGPDSTDAERILVAAAELASAPNSAGLTIADAAQKAARDAHSFEPGPRSEKVERMRRELKQSFGESLEIPPPGQWLEQSLSRLAKASVLRDVVRLGADAQVSPAAQDAVDQFVRQGQQLTDDKREVAAAASQLEGRKEHGLRQLSYFTTYFTTTLAIDVAATPGWAELALKAPVTGYFFAKSMGALRDRSAAQALVASGQQQLRSVRAGLTSTLDKPNAIDQPDLRAVQSARRQERGDRTR